MPGLVRGVARTAAIAGTASAVAGSVNHHQQQKWASQDAQKQAEMEAQAAAQAPQQPTQSGQQTDPQVAQLQQLADLKDQGVITEEEFEAKKKQILGI